MVNRSAVRLQLDFDGTVVEGDASVGILERFVDPSWPGRIGLAAEALLADPGSSDLIESMSEGFSGLGRDYEQYAAFAMSQHPVRPGLRELVDTAARLGIDTHIISNGFGFYIRAYLAAAGVAGRVRLHAGEADADGRLVYRGPDGSPVSRRYKRLWAEHLLSHGGILLYAGDGASDRDAALLANAVFARESLLKALPDSGYEGVLRPFDTLLDISEGLHELHLTTGPAD